MGNKKIPRQNTALGEAVKTLFGETGPKSEELLGLFVFGVLLVEFFNYNGFVGCHFDLL